MTLEITIPAQQVWVEKTEEFLELKETNLQLKHSLISLSKWESKWHKPFLGKEEKTEEEIIDYFRCMTLTSNVDPMIYEHIPQEILKKILDYIDDPMTATWFTQNEMAQSKIGRKETITAEIIYYWMVTLNIPVQFERWHLNRLITLIRTINIKNAPKKKMNKKDILAQNKRLNAARRAKHGTKG